MKNTETNVDFLVVTAMEDEFEAFRRILGGSEKLEPEHITTIKSSDSLSEYRVVFTITDQTTNPANSGTSRAINRFHPSAVILAGVAGGFKESGVHYGDILVPYWIAPYEYAKLRDEPSSGGYYQIEETRIGKRIYHDIRGGNPLPVSEPFWQAARNLKLDDNRPWLRLIRTPRPKSGISVVHASKSSALGSGDKLVATAHAPCREYLRRRFKDDALGVEMESFGVITAVRSCGDILFLVVKAVQDPATGEKDDEKIKDEWRPYALEAAAAFSLSLMERFNPAPYSSKHYGTPFNKWAIKSLRTTAMDNVQNILMGEKTLYQYRARDTSFKHWTTLTTFLEKRYDVEAFVFENLKTPATLVWSNTKAMIDPELVLGRLDTRMPPHGESDERRYIRRVLEAGPIKKESIDYRVVRIRTTSDVPKIDCAMGRYYDNVLTQYAIEWETNKLINQFAGKGKEKFEAALRDSNSLPLRTQVEEKGNPLLSGKGRCAVISIMTFFVFRRKDGLYCIVRKRSADVGMAPDLFHVLPAGVFESTGEDFRHEWSIKLNVYRELLEELYGIKEMSSSSQTAPEYILRRRPIPQLEKLLQEKRAYFSITGLCVNLLHFGAEICTVLFVDDEKFIGVRKPEVNWEYRKGEKGNFGIRLDKLDRFLSRNVEPSLIVPEAAVCIGLGRKWIRNLLKKGMS